MIIQPYFTTTPSAFGTSPKSAQKSLNNYPKLLCGFGGGGRGSESQ